jgi:secreted PhoX family phosphatase
MSEVSRRDFLVFLGGSAAATALGGLAPLGAAQAGGGGFVLPFTPVRLPHPLGIYTTHKSWLASGIGAGSKLPRSANPALATYTVIDDVVVPPEFERYIILAWGDRPFPNWHDYVGYNHDYTAYIPLLGTFDGLLWVNHEYISYPFSVYSTGDAGLRALGDAFETTIGFKLPDIPAGGFTALGPDDQRLVVGEILYNVGGSVVRIRRKELLGRFSATKDWRNRRYHGLSGVAINATRPGPAYPSSWGAKPHQHGDNNYLVGTGPAATDVFIGVNADGLGNKIIGTFANCSGARTPWNTIISAEENFQVFATAGLGVGVEEGVLPNGSQLGFPAGISTSSMFGLYAEKYGWVVEIDPKNPHKRGKKHTALGRYRHENIAIRCERWERLIAYLGDDRRGGHVWKFVSDDTVRHPKDPDNSALLESGTLYVAKFNADGTGVWIPLLLSTATNPNKPSELGSAELFARGAIDRNGNTRFPRRNGLAGQSVDGGAFTMTTLNEATTLPDYQGKFLSHFYPTQGALLCDAFLAGNLIGGTPCARPEDIEVHPKTRAVFIAMTDGIAGSDGYPDSRIFQVGKYATDIDAKQPPGGLYKIVEDSADGAGTSFHWSVFAAGGEQGAQDGMGFAAADNLLFDWRRNVWGVIDMSTDKHNGFSDTSTPVAQNITHGSTAPADATNLFGIYGNNFMFYIPTSPSDPNAGRIVPFAIGPTRSEMTGPTFVGNTLIVSVQHPCEDSPIGAQAALNRNIEILAFDGASVFDQNRTIPRGSTWPASIALADGGASNPTGLPKPATIGIRRKKGHGDAPWGGDDDH